jgi:shikimate dehydrogenase
VPGPERVLIGLIGAGIQASRSPDLHEAAGAAIGRRLFYHLIDAQQSGFGVADLPRVLDALRWGGFAGANITHPFKEVVVPLLDEVDPVAAVVGAVNTVTCRNRRLRGYNTDMAGFVDAWRERFGERLPGSVVLLGAGGAGRAIGHALLRLGASRLTVLDIDAGRAAALAQALDRHVPTRACAVDEMAAALAAADGLVNCSPVGMDGHPGMPVPAASLRAGRWLAEAVYTPIETALVVAARQAGLAVMTGERLCIHQAAAAFRLFLDAEPDVTLMRRVMASRPSPDGGARA